jgi:hypothetical protein
MTITATDVRAAICKLAAAHPDNTYQKPKGSNYCFYKKGDCSDGSCGCIVGQALVSLNVDFYEKVNASAQALLEELGIMGDTRTMFWIGNVQTSQDGGSTWQEAITHADEWANRYPWNR